MPLDAKWFTDEAPEGGMAFSLKLSEKLHSEKTEFQTIDIYRTEKFGNLMVIDGFVMLTERDNFIYHEMMSHPVLYSHGDPKYIVIIGGGDCGTLREVLKHGSIESAVQIEIDERVTRLAETYFPELTESNHDLRAEFVFGDGIRWMAEAQPENLDVIIVDSTDPIGPAKGLFTEAFYRTCLNALSDRGLVVQQSESPLLHMEILSGMRKAMADAGFADVKTIQFPQPSYPSGWWSATMARKGAQIDSFREEDAASRNFDTRYYTPEVHKGAFAMPAFFVREFQ